MNGTITTWFKDKGFGFIKDENGDNRYFHVIKVANPELIKKDAAVTFEPTNNKGLSAYAVKSCRKANISILQASGLSLHRSNLSWCTARKSPPMPASTKRMRSFP
jgi:cold shock CspA family protein